MRLNPNISDRSLSRVNLFDPAEPEFELFAWLFLFDWVEGYREVIRLEGEVSNLTTISASVSSQPRAPNQLEIPTNSAYYIRCALGYVTFVLLLVSCCVAGYIVSVQGYIEQWNMFELNRVTGTIWIGRPMMLLRGVTALCLLATSQLNLVQAGFVTHFESPPRDLLTTFMSSSEAAWLSYIINDLFSPLTKQYTYSYSYKSSVLLALASSLWSVTSPAKHQIRIQRECSVAVVDYQLVCSGGVMEIGSSARLAGLIGLSFVCCLVCYVVERKVSPQSVPLALERSLFLHAAAKDHFTISSWEHNHVYYIDKASAVLNGILSIEMGRHIYMFDIKSWRHYSMDVSVERRSLTGKHDMIHLAHAIPLIE